MPLIIWHSMFAVFGIGPLELLVAVLVFAIVVHFTRGSRRSSAPPEYDVPQVGRLIAPPNPRLHPCPDCGRMISVRAAACPACGCPNLETTCRDCGAPVTHGAANCDACGASQGA